MNASCNSVDLLPVSSGQFSLVHVLRTNLNAFTAVQWSSDMAITPPMVGERSIAMSMSECLSVREHISAFTGAT